MIENIFMSRAVICAVIFALTSYLIGSVNFSIILSRAISGQDIRKSGSGNAGATNMLRTYGKKMAVITLILDVLKGVMCVVAATMFVSHYYSSAVAEVWGSSDLYMWQTALQTISLPYIAGVSVVLGHNFPLYFGFKGGKGVATSLGVVLTLNWKLGLLIGICAVLVIAITKYVSLGSILGGLAFIVADIVNMVLLGRWNAVQFVCVLILGGMLIIRHHQNIKRLMNGTENKLGEKK